MQEISNTQAYSKSLERVRRDRAEAERRLRQLQDVERYLLEVMGGEELSMDLGNGRFAKLSMAAAAEETLREQGNPLHGKTLTQKLLEGGYQYKKGPKKLAVSLYSTLAKMVKNGDTFTRPRAGYFGLREWAALKTEGGSLSAIE